MEVAEVLIVDDEPEICLLVGHILKSIGVSTDCVNSILEANSKLTNHSYRIIILDNHLTDGLGVDFIQTIKSMHPLSKVIMITAFDTIEDKKRAYEKGADNFLGKPFSKDSICQLVTDFLKENV